MVQLMDNYTKIHIHSDLSSATTNIDSVTKFEDYIKKAKELDMRSIAFTEHGNIFMWKKKMDTCNEYGIKYIHGIECYITATLDEKFRDNFHTCLYSLNTVGMHELNLLISKAYCREDGHFYYVPRITMDEFLNISNNIAVTSACLGGVLHKCKDESVKQKYLDYFIKNKDRCFLEIQHHLVDSQISYNKYLYELHKTYGLALIVGTDTHALNKEHLEGRSILQKSKGIYFDDEEGWDLSFKSYDELIEIYKSHDYISIDEVKTALKNTNVLANMVEDYIVDSTPKYPKLYEDSEKVFKDKILIGMKTRGIDKKDNYEEYKKRVNEEYKVYRDLDSIDYMLLQTKILEDAREHGIQAGYGRGSVNGSLIAYLLGITECDSLRLNLNFFRFMNPARQSMPDIDIDFCKKDREWIKKYLFNIKGVYAADIITFNTIADKGAIRDVCKALYKKEIPKELNERADRDVEGYGALTDSTSKAIRQCDENSYLNTSNYICENVELDEAKMRKEYPEVFRYVDIIKGSIVSIGTHPSGTIVSPILLDKYMGTCTLATTKNPVSMLYMKEVDKLSYVKLDVLGLDSIGIINDTCELAGIPRLNPDNVDLYDDKVWESIKENTTAIFQMESDMAHKYFGDITKSKVIERIKKHNPDITMFELFMFICGAIRPAGENFRNDACNGILKNNGIKELNDLLYETLNYLLLQEQIMQFLVRFCGYSDAESDLVRREIAKKGDTTPMLDEIRQRFLAYTPDKYNISMEKAIEIIEPFLLDIKAASGYGFSKNHNVPYSITGYCQGWLRYYYPLEFLSSCLNTWSDDENKTNRIMEYTINRGINLLPPRFRYSKGGYFYNKEANSIYKGIGSIKFLNSSVADDLYNLRDNSYSSFYDLLKDIKEKTSCNSKQLDLLVRCDYFNEFGGINKILNFIKYFDILHLKKAPKKKTVSEKILLKSIVNIIENNSSPTEATYTKFDYDKSLQEIWISLKNEDANLQDKISFQKEILGYTDYKNDKLDKRYVLISDIDTRYSPTMNTYCLNNGKTVKCKISKKIWNNVPLQENQVIYIHDMERKFGQKKVGETTDKKGKIKPIFEPTEEIVWWISNYVIINDLGDDLEE